MAGGQMATRLVLILAVLGTAIVVFGAFANTSKGGRQRHASAFRRARCAQRTVADPDD
jgi:hypothetical protein